MACQSSGPTGPLPPGATTTQQVVLAPEYPLQRRPYRPSQEQMWIYRVVAPGVTQILPGDRVRLTATGNKTPYDPLGEGVGVILAKLVPVTAVAWAGDAIGEWIYNP